MATWKKIITSGSIAELAQLTASGTITGSLTGSIKAHTADINGGTLDNVVIGGGTAAAASVTSLDVANGNITNVGDIDADSISIADAGVGLNIAFGGNTTKNKITLTDNLADALNVLEGSNSYIKFTTTNSSEQIVFGQNSTFNGTTIADLGTVTTADINGGTIDGADVTVGSGKTLDVSGGTLTLANNQISGDKVEGGTIASITISELGGALDANNQNITNIDVDSGAIDGVAIGSADAGGYTRSTAAVTVTGSFTGSYYGDGSNLTGVSTDIDSLDALGGTGLHQTQDKFLFSDNGTEKSITFSNLEDAIFGNVSGDATIAGGGAVTLAGAQTNVDSFLKADFKIGEDDETKIDFETADEIHFYANNVHQVKLQDTVFTPQADSDVDLGATGTRWKDAYIDTITTTGNVNVGGDLIVDGDLKTVSTTNVETGDRLIFLASGSHNVGEGGLDAGILVQSGSAAGTGSALYHDLSDQRWAVAKGVTASGSLHVAQAPTSHIVTVTTNNDTPSGDGQYGVGEMHIDANASEPTGDGVIYIRTN